MGNLRLCTSKGLCLFRLGNFPGLFLAFHLCELGGRWWVDILNGWAYISSRHLLFKSRPGTKNGAAAELAPRHGGTQWVECMKNLLRSFKQSHPFS